jgi:hypothetical protein
MSNFTFDYDLFSDLHKDAYGMRPRGHIFYDESTSDERRQKFWDDAIEDLEIREQEEARERARAIIRFQDWIGATIDAGAADGDTALRWMVQDQTFYSIQDVEQWVWEQGILFTDYGRRVVKKLDKLVEYKEMDWF